MTEKCEAPNCVGVVTRKLCDRHIAEVGTDEVVSLRIENLQLRKEIEQLRAAAPNQIDVIQRGTIGDLHGILDAALADGCRGGLLITIKGVDGQCLWNATTKGAITLPELVFISEGLKRTVLDRVPMTSKNEPPPGRGASS